MNSNDARGNDEQPSNLARALWVFLGYTLVGPLLAGLSTAILVIFASIVGVSELFSNGLPPLGIAAASTFVWAAIPSAVTAALLLPFVIQTGTFGWIEAVTAAVLAFAIATIVTTFPYRDGLPLFAFIAAMISLGVREALRNAKIIE